MVSADHGARADTFRAFSGQYLLTTWCCAKRRCKVAPPPAVGGHYFALSLLFMTLNKNKTSEARNTIAQMKMPQETRMELPHNIFEAENITTPRAQTLIIIVKFFITASD